VSRIVSLKVTIHTIVAFFFLPSRSIPSIHLFILFIFLFVFDDDTEAAEDVLRVQLHVEAVVVEAIVVEVVVLLNFVVAAWGA